MAHGYTNVIGERVLADNSKNNVHKKNELGVIWFLGCFLPSALACWRWTIFCTMRLVMWSPSKTIIIYLKRDQSVHIHNQNCHLITWRFLFHGFQISNYSFSPSGTPTPCNCVPDWTPSQHWKKRMWSHLGKGVHLFPSLSLLQWPDKRRPDQLDFMISHSAMRGTGPSWDCHGGLVIVVFLCNTKQLTEKVRTVRK